MIDVGTFYEGNVAVIRAWLIKDPTRSIKEAFTEGEFNALCKDRTKLWDVKVRLMGQVAKVLEGDYIDV